MSTEKVKCPYCAEEIQADAKKCRWCGEWLVDPPPKRPVETAREWETVIFDVRRGEMALGATLLNQIPALGSQTTIVSGWLIAHIHTPDLSDTAPLDEFYYDADRGSINRIIGFDLAGDLERLDLILQALRDMGYELVEKGHHWYSYKFRRRWDPNIGSPLLDLVVAEAVRGVSFGQSIRNAARHEEAAASPARPYAGGAEAQISSGEQARTDQDMILLALVAGGLILLIVILAHC